MLSPKVVAWIVLPLLLPEFVLTQSSVITIGLAPDPVAAIAAKDGEVTGFFADVLREAVRREGSTPAFRLKRQPLEEAIGGGEVDVFAGAFATPERRRNMYFARPWWREPYYIVSREATGVRVISDLAGRTLLYEQAPPLPAPVEAVAPGARVSLANSRGDRISRVCSGDAEAALINHLALVDIMAQRPEPCRGVSLRILQPEGLPMWLSIAAPFSRREMADRIRDRIDEMYADGTMAAISRKYPLSPLADDQFQIVSSGPLSNRLMPALWFGFSALGAAALVLLFAARRKAMRALARAEAAVKSKDEFLAMLCHEIRTPMNAAMGFLDLLQETPLQPEQRQLSQDMAKSASALLSLTGDLMEFSRLRAGEIEIRKEPSDVVSLAEEVIASHRWLADSKSLELLLEIRPDIPARLLLDAERLRQVLTNLIGNALKFTVSGYVKLWVGYAEDTLQITVSDSGPGIGQEHFQRIFQPFQQVDRSGTRRHSGIGLGLAIARQLTERMGGTLDLDSRPRFGSHFKVRLPSGVAEGRGQPWIEQLSPYRGASVVIVARASYSLSVLREYLAAAGIEIACYAEEGEARHHISSGKVPTCICTDPLAIADVDAWVRWVRETCRSAPPKMVLTGTIAEMRLLPDSVREQFAAVAPYPVGPGTLLEIFRTAEQREPRSPEANPGNGSNGAAAILVVDDNPINRKVAAALLTKLGCTVDIAEDGNAAVDRAAAHSYAMILMDCQMPGMDGYEAAQRIRNSPRGAAVPIIGVSASIEEDTAQRCRAAGMDAFLPKPLTLAGLSRLLQEAGKMQEPPV